MAVSNIKIKLPYSIDRIWNVVVSLTDYGWRSDLSSIRDMGNGEFIETDKKGYSTNFKITTVKKYELYEFEMDNSNICGNWTGKFIESDGQVLLDFTEDAVVKKWYLKPFLKSFLRKQQERYINDLEMKLMSFK